MISGLNPAHFNRNVRTRCNCALALTLVMFAVPATLLAYDNDIEREIDVNLTIQRAIENIEKATTPQEFDEKLTNLLERARDNRALALEQLLHYAAREGATTEDRTLTAKAIKEMDFGGAIVVSTFAPHLDNKDERVRKMAREWLIHFEDRSAARKPYFGHYLPLIKAELAKGEAPQFSLIEHMYQGDAGLAVLTMMRAYDLREPTAMKPILWTEHIVADLLWQRRFGFVARDFVEPEVVNELGNLSRSPHWWARLYVAHVIINNPDLADAEWANALTRDTHELVRAAAETYKDKVRPTNR